MAGADDGGIRDADSCEICGCAHVVVVLWVQDADSIDAASSWIRGQVGDILGKGVGPELDQLPVADA
jgi:hypothetical protein